MQQNDQAENQQNVNKFKINNSIITYFDEDNYYHYTWVEDKLVDECIAGGSEYCFIKSEDDDSKLVIYYEDEDDNTYYLLRTFKDE